MGGMVDEIVENILERFELGLYSQYFLGGPHRHLCNQWGELLNILESNKIPDTIANVKWQTFPRVPKPCRPNV